MAMQKVAFIDFEYSQKKQFDSPEDKKKKKISSNNSRADQQVQPKPFSK